MNRGQGNDKINDLKLLIENERKKREEIKEFGYAKTEVEKTYPSLF